MLAESILLEELEGLDAPSTVGEEETQVILSNSLPGRQEQPSSHSKQQGSWSNSVVLHVLQYRILER